MTRAEENIKSIIRDTGDIVSFHDYGDGEWTVVVSTEYAALKLHYAFRKSSGDFGFEQCPTGYLFWMR